MKIIMVDNYNRETVADQLVATNVSPHEAIYIVEALNANPKRGNETWYRLVDDNYRLSMGMEDLV